MATVRPIPQITDAFRVEPVVHRDARGLFVETYREEWLPDAAPMVQANRGDRIAGTIVGLHFHLHQADYWYVPTGTVRVVLFDLREGSPTEGRSWTTDLGAQPDGSHCHDGIYIPRGVGHGFAALTDATVSYLVDGYYNPDDELGVAWNDPEIDVDWGVNDPVLSGRDQANPRRVDLPVSIRPRHPGWAS